MTTNGETVSNGSFPITVIICAYNAANTISEQLDALAPQVNRLGAELIVVDNKSSDNLKAIIESYTATIPNLRLVDAHLRQGKPHAINVGISHSRSHLIAMTDADDVVSENWLASHIEGLAIEQMSTGPIDISTLNPTRAPTPPPTWGEQPQLDFLPFMSGSNQGFHKTLFEELGGMDESMLIGEDITLSWRMQLSGAKIFFAPNALVKIRYRGADQEDWNQTYSFAKAHTHLYKLFKNKGMPSSDRKEISTRYKRILTGVRYYRGMPADERYKWKRQLAIAVGHIAGSIQNRVWYL